GGVFLVGSADLADQQGVAGVGVFLEQAQAVDVVEAAHRVGDDADARALSHAEAGALPDGLVGERAAAADDADGLAGGVAGLGAVHVDIAWHDADFAARVGVWLA